MTNFPVWSRQWFYLWVLRHWSVASPLFLTIAPLVLVIVYSLLTPNTNKHRTMLLTFLSGTCLSISYIVFTLVDTVSQLFGLIGIAFSFIPLMFAWKDSKDGFITFIKLSIGMGVTFYMAITLFYLAYLYYALAPMFTDRRISILIERHNMLTGAKIGLPFLLIYGAALAFLIFKDKKRQSKGSKLQN